MADKYYRLIYIVVNVCTEPVRELFLKLARSDSVAPFKDLNSYLGFRRTDIAQLLKKKIIRQDQHDMLFPRGVLPDVSQWDITLLVTLIKNLFGGHLKPMEVFDLEEIRDIRNKLQHVPNTTHMPDSTFNDYYARLKSTTESLAKEVAGSKYENEIEEKIQTALLNHMPDLGNALKVFYEEDRRQLLSDMKQIVEDQQQIANQLTNVRDELKKVKENEKQMAEEIKDLRAKTDVVTDITTDSNTILHGAIVTKVGNDGEKLKLFKTVDHNTERLKMQFKRTFSKVPEGFAPSRGVPEISQQLRDNGHVIVAGGQNSNYLKTALYALKDLKYSVERCVEIADSSDWRHVDPGEVSLVLWQNPFGHSTYDGVKAASMFGLLDTMYLATHPSEGTSALVIVMVSDMDILAKARTVMKHPLLDGVVKLFDSTTPSHPDDLTGTCTGTALREKKMVPGFSSQITSIILDKYECSTIDSATLQSAKTKLNKNKSLLITGPPTCGKTLLVRALANSYMYAREDVAFLFSPDEIREIDLMSTSLVVIDDVIGKYVFDKNEVGKWYIGLDILYEAVKAGKLNVIITTTDKTLKQCIDEVSSHPLLSYPEVIGQNIVNVKPETSHEEGNGREEDDEESSGVSTISLCPEDNITGFGNNPLSRFFTGDVGEDSTSVRLPSAERLCNCHYWRPQRGKRKGEEAKSLRAERLRMFMGSGYQESHALCLPVTIFERDQPEVNWNQVFNYLACKVIRPTSYQDFFSVLFSAENTRVIIEEITNTCPNITQRIVLLFHRWKQTAGNINLEFSIQEAFRRLEWRAELDKFNQYMRLERYSVTTSGSQNLQLEDTSQINTSEVFC